jgi:NAD-dependent deacetylase
LNAKPNRGHIGIAELEDWFDVDVITQNVDDLHEQAGSTKVLHLHGELMKARSTVDPGLVYELDDWELKTGDFCEKGSQLRPHIVWFGEPVPAFDEAISVVQQADILVVIGTSLEVYPAAGLVNYTLPDTHIFVIDPGRPEIYSKDVTYIREKAGKGVEILKEKLEKLR